jgi:hypothetical protein
VGRMPAHRLTASPGQIAARVEAVCAGATVETAAADIGLDPAVLAETVQTYRTAGLAALQRRQERAWFQAPGRPRRLRLPQPRNQRLRTRTATTRRHRGHLNPA